MKIDDELLRAYRAEPNKQRKRHLSQLLNHLPAAINQHTRRLPQWLSRKSFRSEIFQAFDNCLSKIANNDIKASEVSRFILAELDARTDFLLFPKYDQRGCALPRGRKIGSDIVALEPIAIDCRTMSRAKLNRMRKNATAKQRTVIDIILDESVRNKVKAIREKTGLRLPDVVRLLNTIR